MPLTNPGREGLEGGQTVFIDGPLDLPSQLMHQELENLVVLSELDNLQDASHSQIIDTSSVLLTDEMEQMEESDDDIAMETSIQDGNHSMDVDCLPNSTTPGMAAELSSIVPMEASLIDGTTSQSRICGTMQKMKEVPLNIVEASASHTAKTTSNQFVILQPNQNSSFISLGGKLVPTGQIFSSIPSTNNNKNLINNFQANTKQFRTIQVKHPSQPSQNNGGTKVIINNQPTNFHQIRNTSQHNNDNSMQTNAIIKVENKDSPSKMAIQFQPVALSLGQRNVFQSISKVAESKSATQLAVPMSFAIRPTSNVSTTVKQEHNEIQIHGSASSATVNSPQKIYIKGTIPLSSLKAGQIISESQLIKLPTSQNSQPQSMQLTNKINYVRLVNQTTNESSTHTNSTVVQSAPKVVNLKTQLAPVTSHGLSIKSISLSGSGTLPLNSSPAANVQVRTSGNLSIPASAQVLSNTAAGSLVMIPAHLLQNNSSSNGPSVIQVASQLSPTLPNVAKAPPTKTMIDANGIKSRKPCNCTKSQCLKLYCDCFANGEFCNNCNCNNCFNNLKHEEDRQKAIRSCLERNPQAFRPKIGKGGMENKRRHNKGCNCKRSGCLKNYCECYEAKIPCSRICKCIGCRNVDNCQNFDRKRLLEIAETSEAKVNHKIYIQNKAISLSSLPSPAKMMYPSGGKSTQCRINQEVVAATCHCLLAQTEKASRVGVEEAEKEQMVINEFSRCLLQIIGCNAKSKD